MGPLRGTLGGNSIERKQFIGDGIEDTPIKEGLRGFYKGGFTIKNI